MPRKPEIHECELYLHGETDKAYGVSVDGDRDEMVWLPKSQVEQHERSKIDGCWFFSIPQWLAEEKELV